MKILRVKGDTLYLYDLTRFIENNDLDEGDRFGISWKVKKKKKLRSYRVIRFRFWACDNCGPITEITLKRGEKSIVLDNHFGAGWFSMND